MNLLKDINMTDLLFFYPNPVVDIESCGHHRAATDHIRISVKILNTVSKSQALVTELRWFLFEVLSGHMSLLTTMLDRKVMTPPCHPRLLLKTSLGKEVHQAVKKCKSPQDSLSPTADCKARQGVPWGPYLVKEPPQAVRGSRARPGP